MLGNVEASFMQVAHALDLGLDRRGGGHHLHHQRMIHKNVFLQLREESHKPARVLDPSDRRLLQPAPLAQLQHAVGPSGCALGQPAWVDANAPSPCSGLFQNFCQEDAPVPLPDVNPGAGLDLPGEGVQVRGQDEDVWRGGQEDGVLLEGQAVVKASSPHRRVERIKGPLQKHVGREAGHPVGLPGGPE